MIHTGLGLNVCITSHPTFYHNWMAFACFLSLKRYLPDAHIEISVGRRDLQYDWAKRMRLRLRKQPPEAGFKINPECIAVREWSGDSVQKSLAQQSFDPSMFADAKSKENVVFADVTNGVGSFVSSAWLNSTSCFLSRVNQLRTGKETSLELAVFREWQKAANLAVSLGF